MLWDFFSFCCLVYFDENYFFYYYHYYHDIRCEIRASEPLVAYRETVLSCSDTQLIGGTYSTYVTWHDTIKARIVKLNIYWFCFFKSVFVNRTIFVDILYSATTSCVFFLLRSLFSVLSFLLLSLLFSLLIYCSFFLFSLTSFPLNSSPSDFLFPGLISLPFLHLFFLSLVPFLLSPFSFFLSFLLFHFPFTLCTINLNFIFFTTIILLKYNINL